ncbi:endonuclease [Aquimarina sp. D1M17]|uniref:endonuclease n=1 Tax=Aquimarina acroporae TaxID=2937283 RepID=UPI0020BE89EB|nr:endonuclease [Aquimarina acroporae]MCK8524124.1 endonuclease [Aquimarina acroporae]
MKKALQGLLLAISATIYSQVPSYYNDVNLNLSGQALQSELATKVTNTHTTFLSYTPGVWDALQQTDLDPNNSSRVVLIYGYSDTDGNSTTDRTRGVNNNGGGSTDWNREHVYPRSLGNPNLGSEGPGSDAHHLRPADVQRNSSRGNRKFADGSGNSGTTSQGHWYPGDEWKGDVARMMMYMYIRYGNRCLPTNVGVGTTVSSDPDMIQLFLEWNAEDPVSQLELQRNPLLENIQGNRNPFIDNPAFATQIWGGPQAEDRFGNTGGGDTTVPSIPTNLTASNITTTAVTLAWSASTDNVGVTGYDIYQNNTLLTTVNSTGYAVSGLTPNTSYSYYVRAKDAAGNISNASVIINITTQNDNTGGGAATELFISEYIEGSSNNKAIEIANFTGTAMNLSGYEIRRQTNGSGSWSAGVNLTGTVSNNDVYVIANNSANTTIKNVADLTTSASPMTFNGNDPVGLFKNGTLIDIIGTFNGGSSNFAKDVTLRRKPSVGSPSANYDTAEWDSFPQNTFDDLGNHSFNGGGGSGPDTEAPTVPTNLTVSNLTQTSLNLTWNASSDNVEVVGYSVFQNGVLMGTTSSTGFSVSGLSAATAYSFEVTANDAANNTSSAATITATTLSNTISYCATKGNNTNYEFIDYVEIGGISNATAANGGYGDFTSQTGTLSYGSNTVILSIGFVSANYTENWAVWIDFNKNGTFESAEQVVTGATSNPGNLSYSFTVPSSALSGNTRMRVSMKWNGAPTSCETFGYGEVEDYTVNIGGSASRALNGIQKVKIDGELGVEDKVFSAQIAPNPAKEYLSIRLGDNRKATYTITDIRGRLIKKGSVTNNRIELEGLQGGLYMFRISDGSREIVKKVVIN